MQRLQNPFLLVHMLHLHSSAGRELWQAIFRHLLYKKTSARRLCGMLTLGCRNAWIPVLMETRISSCTWWAIESIAGVKSTLPWTSFCRYKNSSIWCEPPVPSRIDRSSVLISSKSSSLITFIFSATRSTLSRATSLRVIRPALGILRTACSSETPLPTTSFSSSAILTAVIGVAATAGPPPLLLGSPGHVPWELALSVAESCP
uniref:Uncharacterized protein n=1 Tax=Arundo donax TaxID=35708 RepID=A0A0A9DEZ1_ARUDO